MTGRLRQGLTTFLIVTLVLLAFRGLHSITGTPTLSILHDLLMAAVVTTALILSRLPRP